jgi:hypothetical protein
VLFEGFIATQIVKAQLNAGRRRELYFFCDEQGLEMDFGMPGPNPCRRPWRAGLDMAGFRSETIGFIASSGHATYSPFAGETTATKL